MYSSSALRFSPDLRSLAKDTIGAEPVRLVIARGANDFRRQYAVHTAEMLVVLLGTGARRVIHAGTPATPVVLVDYADGRRGLLELNSAVFGLFVEYGGKGATAAVEIKQDFWNGDAGFVHSLLRFFETRASPVPEAETLEVVALLEAGARATEEPYTWIPVPPRAGA